MITNFLKAIWAFIEEFFATKDEVVPAITTPEVTETPEEVVEVPKYEWDTKAKIRHSMRVIGDEMGLTILQKDLLCDICQCESGYVLKARLENSPTSIDRGLFQINSRYHKEATDELAYNPEWSTRWACRAIINNQAHAMWSASEKCWNKTGKYNNIV